MTPFQLYLLLKMDSLKDIILGISIIFWVLTIVFIIVWIYQWIENDKKIGFAKGIIFLMIGLFLSISSELIPSTKQVAAIIVVPKIITSIENNKELMALPGEITSIASEWIKELKPKKDTILMEGK